MICNVVGVLICLSVFGIVASGQYRAIDCRRHVFAPICRGAASKRANSENGQIALDFDNDRIFQGNLYKGEKMSEDDDYRDSKSTIDENQIRKNKHQRYVLALYKLLSGSTKKEVKKVVEEFEYL